MIRRPAITTTDYTCSMELPPLSQIFTRALSADAGDNLLDVSRLQSGAQLLAKVEAAVAIDPALRARILLFLKNELAAQATAQAKTQVQPAAQTENQTRGNEQAQTQISRQSPGAEAVRHLEKLFSQPNLYAAQLSTLGKRVLIFTQEALSQGSKIPVTVRPDGQLQLTGKAENPPNTTTKNNAAYPKQLNAAQSLQNTLNNQTARTLQTDQASNQNATNNRSLSEAQIQSVRAALRQYLPVQQPVTATATQARNIVDTYNLLGRPALPLHITKFINTLENIVKGVPTPTQLTEPKTLSNFIGKSGAFFENSLSIKSNPEGTQNASKDSNNNINSSLTQQIAQLQGNTPTDSDKDTKAQLLRLLEQISNPIQPGTTITPSSSAIRSQQLSNLDKLLQNLFSGLLGKGTANDVSSQPKDLLQQRLRPSVMAAIARITTLQIQHALKGQQQEGGRPLPGAMLELPVRIGEQFYPLTIHLTQKEIEEKKEDKKRRSDESKKTEARRRWEVYLEFDLYELGKLASDLSVIENSVSAKLWVEQEPLWKESQKHLTILRNELEQAGVTVEKISCVQGLPDEKPQGMSQSLVDVRT